MKFTHTDLPAEKQYPKLVRDQIIRLIRQSGGAAKWSIIKSDKEFLKYLLKKLSEEAAEAGHALVKGNLKEELADVLEVMDEILKLKNWVIGDIRKMQKEKRRQNGGFKKRIKLVEIKQ